MNTQDPSETAQYLVMTYVRLETDGDPATEAKIVWFCYILGGWKALVIVDTNPNYYEVTYNVNENAVYIDEYKKVSNKVFHDYYSGD